MRLHCNVHWLGLNHLVCDPIVCVCSTFVHICKVCLNVILRSYCEYFLCSKSNFISNVVRLSTFARIVIETNFGALSKAQRSTKGVILWTGNGDPCIPTIPRQLKRNLLTHASAMKYKILKLTIKMTYCPELSFQQFKNPPILRSQFRYRHRRPGVDIQSQWFQICSIEEEVHRSLHRLYHTDLWSK